MQNNLGYVLFGSPPFSVDVLNELKAGSLLPEVIVTAPDKQRGRGQKTKPTPVKAWAQGHGIDVLTPESIDQTFIDQLNKRAPEGGWPLFVVVAYGKILPEDVIYLPEHNTLNLHPSLLPKVRGAAPIRGSILEENKAGVTVIELDEQMDHGPIIAQREVDTQNWPPRYDELKPKLAHAGGQFLAETIPDWVKGSIAAQPQDHSQATYMNKFSSDDGEIDLSDDPKKNLRKIRAFTDWPKAHFYTEDNTRVIICKAHLEDGELKIDTVKPAGSKAIDYDTFKKENSSK
jgi:methionyl-tRNA formyltransferase